MPVQIKFDPHVTMPQVAIIQDATINSDGVMTAAMVRKLAAFSGSLPGVYNIMDYGAKADGVFAANKWTGTNNLAAVQAAYDACKAGGGGTVVIPQGAFYTQGALTYTSTGLDDQIVTIAGVGSSSILIVDALTLNFMTIANLGLMRLANFVLVGADQTRADDCDAVLVVSTVHNLCFDNMLFIGLGGTDYIVRCDTTGLYFNNTQWEGCCVANVNVSNGCVSAVRNVGAMISDCTFVDFGNLAGVFYSKTPNGMPKWIGVLQSTSVGANGGATFVIEGCLFDEGGSFGVACSSDDGLSTITSLRVVGCTFYIGIIVGLYINSTYNAVVDQCSFNCKGEADKNMIIVEDTVGMTFISNIHRETGGPGGSGRFAFGADAGLRPTAPIELTNVEYDSIHNVFSVHGIPVINISQDGVRARMRIAQNTVEANTLAKVGATDGFVDQLGAADNARLATGVILDAGAANDVVRVVEEEGQEVVVLSDGALVLANGDILTSSGASAGRVTSTTTPGQHTTGNTVVGGANVADTPVQMLWARSLY